MAHIKFSNVANQFLVCQIYCRFGCISYLGFYVLSFEGNFGRIGWDIFLEWTMKFESNCWIIGNTEYLIVTFKKFTKFPSNHISNSHTILLKFDQWPCKHFCGFSISKNLFLFSSHILLKMQSVPHKQTRQRQKNYFQLRTSIKSFSSLWLQIIRII